MICCVSQWFCNAAINSEFLAFLGKAHDGKFVLKRSHIADRSVARWDQEDIDFMRKRKSLWGGVYWEGN